MKTVKRVLIVLVILALLGWISLAARSSEATYQELPDQVCDEGLHIGNPNCEVDVDPTEEPEATPTEEWDEVEPTEEVTPSVELTVTPTATPEASTTNNVGGPGDGRSDGRSDGLCSKPPCVPLGAPNTGRAL